MCPSNSGGSPPPQPTFIDPVTGRAFWSPEQLNVAITEREVAERAKTAETKATADAKLASDKSTYDTRLSGAVDRSRAEANKYFTDYGADPTKYHGDIERELARITGTVPDLSPNPGGFFANNVGASVFNEQTTAGRARARDQYTSQFDSGAIDRALNTSLLDPVRSSLLSEQFDPLSAQLGTAHKRGTLNDTGYASALAALQGSRNKASAEIDNAGRSVLGSGQKSLQDLIGTMGGEVNRWNLPKLEQINFLPQQERFNSEANRLSSGFGGQVSSALGDVKFADLNTLLNAGGVGQGAIGAPRANQPGAMGGNLESLLTQQVAAKSPPRGLGNSGVF